MTNKDPEGFTEIYFYGDIPKHITLGENNTFSFVIYNREFKKMVYTYKVNIASNVLRQATVSLDHNEKKVVLCPFRVTENPHNGLLIISVSVNEEHSIHFWASVR
jgi:uncharacterized membrane protein